MVAVITCWEMKVRDIPNCVFQFRKKEWMRSTESYFLRLQRDVSSQTNKKNVQKVINKQKPIYCFKNLPKISLQSQLTYDTRTHFVSETSTLSNFFLEDPSAKWPVFNEVVTLWRNSFMNNGFNSHSAAKRMQFLMTLKFAKNLD